MNIEKLYRISDDILYRSFSSITFDFKVNKNDVDINTSEEKLNLIESDIGDVATASYENKLDNRIYISNLEPNRYEINNLKKIIGALASEINDIDKYEPSGYFWYPCNSWCGWHTNSNKEGKRIYLTYTQEDNKSFFRYRDINTNKIITNWEKVGWQINKFEVPMWHCVGSYTNRFSIGFLEKK